MNIIHGNIWRSLSNGYFDAVCMITSGEVNNEGNAIFNSITAIDIASKTGKIENKLGDFLSRYGIRVFNLGTLKINDEVSVKVVSFPAKYYHDDPVNAQLIYHSYKELSEMAVKFKWHKILLPLPIEDEFFMSEAALVSLIYPIYDKRIQFIRIEK